MAKLIKQGKVVDDSWRLLEKSASEFPDGLIIVALDSWLAQREQLAGRTQLGLWLDSDQSADAIAADLDRFQLIAVNFPAFTDGRGFSIARTLRDRYGFTGELRAIGSFIRDQLFYLKRCGFDTFALSQGDIDAALSSLGDFSDAYQAGCDQPLPLFRRR